MGEIAVASRPWVWVLGVSMVGLLAAGCSPSPGSVDLGSVDPGSVDSAASGDPADGLAEWADCMADLGVDVDLMLRAATDRDALALVAANPNFVAAEETCRPLFQAATGTTGPDPEVSARMADQSAGFAKCVADKTGIQLPDDILLLPADDPTLAELDKKVSDPADQAAVNSCFSSATAGLSGRADREAPSDEGLPEEPIAGLGPAPIRARP